VEPEKFLNEEGNKLNGLEILKRFVTGHDSLTYVKRRNIQIRRWEERRQRRVAAGLPADPPLVDKAILDSLIEKFRNQASAIRVLKQKSFHPDMGEQSGASGEKNYIVRKKFGSQPRNERPPW